jgi:hypothetical protein
MRINFDAALESVLQHEGEGYSAVSFARVSRKTICLT